MLSGITDTHALVWYASGASNKLGVAARRIFEAADRKDGSGIRFDAPPPSTRDRDFIGGDQMLRGFGAGRRCPRMALPVGQVPRHGPVHAFPPHAAVVGHGHIGQDRVAGDRVHGVGVRLAIGAGCYTEVAAFGVDGPQPAIWPDVDPGDVLADGPHLPAVCFKR